MLAEVYHFGRMEEAPNRIRELRLEAGLSQQALADRVGVSKVTISDLERGVMQLTQDYMRRIAVALEIYSADLLPLSENPDALTVRERRHLGVFRGADPVQQEQIEKLADVIVPFRPAPSTGRKSA